MALTLLATGTIGTNNTHLGLWEEKHVLSLRVVNSTTSVLCTVQTPVRLDRVPTRYKYTVQYGPGDLHCRMVLCQFVLQFDLGAAVGTRLAKTNQGTCCSI